MRKTYIRPTTLRVNICSKRVMIGTSTTTITNDNKSSFDYARQDNGWDIWGNEDSEE